MKSFLILLFSLAAAPAFALQNLCELQANAYMGQFLTGIESVDWIYADYGDESGGNTDTQAWVKPTGCDGYVVMEFATDELNCTIAHYGSYPNYLSRVWTTGDCAYLPLRSEQTKAYEPVKGEVPPQAKSKYGKGIVQDQVIEVPQQQVIEVPQQQVIEVPQQQVIEVPQHQVIEVPQQQVIEAPQAQIVNGKGSKVDLPVGQTGQY